MTISKLRIIYTVILIGIVAIMIAVIIHDPTDIKLLAKCVVLIIAYIGAIIKLESRRSSFAGRSYELKYQDLIGDAFANNKRAKKKLIKGIILYNDGKYDAAVSGFDDLRKDCVRPVDYAAILTFRALCFSERKGYNEAIATYKELLNYDPQNSRAWSNLGLNYVNSGRTDLAVDAYRNAIRANDKNAYARTNFAVLLLDMDETEEALEQAKAALQINANLQQAISAACLACARLGDNKGAQEYLQRYARAGGDREALEEMMDLEREALEEMRAQETN